MDDMHMPTRLYAADSHHALSRNGSKATGVENSKVLTPPKTHVFSFRAHFFHYFHVLATFTTAGTTAAIIPTA
jgi:hypothetical protein